MLRKSALVVVFSFLVAVLGIPASTAVAAPPSFRDSAILNANTTNPSVTVPESVQAGDQLVLIVTFNRNVSIDTPAGWTQLGVPRQDGSPDMTSAVFTRTADGATAGTTVTTPLGAISKTAMTLVAYAGATPPLAATSSIISGSSANLTTPDATIADADSIVLSYWGNKTSGNTGWTLPGSVTPRATSIGSGGGRITAAIGDTVAPAGNWTGTTATSTVSGSKGVAWTIVLPPVEPGVNADPIAAFTSDCDDLACTFTSTSTDTDGTIDSHAWTFGDGATSNLANPIHTYAGEGPVTVGLTVTDNDDATGTTSQTFTVSITPNADPTASFTYDCDDLACTFTDASTDTDGTIDSHAWTFGDGATSNLADPTHIFGSAGTYTVGLTVTDNETGTGSTSQPVTVAIAGPSTLEFRAATSANSNTDSPSVTVPASVEAGDQLVLIVTANRNVSIDTPAGWTQLGVPRQDGSPDMTSAVFTRTADGATAGTTVTTPLDGFSKTARTLVAYAGATPPLAATSAILSGSSANLTTPDATIDVDNSIVLSYWGNKTSGNTGWTLPGSVTPRATSIGSGGGRITAAIGDTVAPAGNWTGTTATSTVSGSKGVAWTIVLSPADTNAAPIAAFTSSCTLLECTFTDTSTDTDGTINSHAWDFGDGATSTDANPVHPYTAEGVVTVELTVTDNDGATGSVTDTVNPVAPNQLPTADFTYVCDDLECTFTDTSTDPDPDGTIVSHAWTFGDGATSTAPTRHTPSAREDTYTVELTVTDNETGPPPPTKTSPLRSHRTSTRPPTSPMTVTTWSARSPTPPPTPTARSTRTPGHSATAAPAPTPIRHTPSAPKAPSPSHSPSPTTKQVPTAPTKTSPLRSPPTSTRLPRSRPPATTSLAVSTPAARPTTATSCCTPGTSATAAPAPASLPSTLSPPAP